MVCTVLKGRLFLLLFLVQAPFTLGTENLPQEWTFPQHSGGGSASVRTSQLPGATLGFQGPTWPLMVAILAFPSLLPFIVLMPRLWPPTYDTCLGRPSPFCCHPLGELVEGTEEEPSSRNLGP